MAKQPAIVMVVLVMLLSGTAVSAQEMRHDRPTIIEARIFLHDGMLMSDLTSTGLFSDRVTGTIQSGLPAVVELLYRLISRKHNMMSRGLHVYELRYDVWEDLYTIRDEDSTLHYSSFEAMASAVERMRRIAIIPAASIDRNDEYAVEFSIAVHPLRSREKQRIIGWVGEQMRGDAGVPWHENVVNLNDLIQHFFSQNKDGADRSKWYQTDFFNPRLLPAEDGEKR